MVFKSFFRLNDMAPSRHSSTLPYLMSLGGFGAALYGANNFQDIVAPSLVTSCAGLLWTLVIPPSDYPTTTAMFAATTTKRNLKRRRVESKSAQDIVKDLEDAYVNFHYARRRQENPSRETILSQFPFETQNGICYQVIKTFGDFLEMELKNYEFWDEMICYGYNSLSGAKQQLNKLDITLHNNLRNLASKYRDSLTANMLSESRKSTLLMDFLMAINMYKSEYTKEMQERKKIPKPTIVARGSRGVKVFDEQTHCQPSVAVGINESKENLLQIARQFLFSNPKFIEKENISINDLALYIFHHGNMDTHLHGEGTLGWKKGLRLATNEFERQYNNRVVKYLYDYLVKYHTFKQALLDEIDVSKCPTDEEVQKKTDTTVPSETSEANKSVVIEVPGVSEISLDTEVCEKKVSTGSEISVSNEIFEKKGATESKISVTSDVCEKKEATESEMCSSKIKNASHEVVKSEINLNERRTENESMIELSSESEVSEVSKSTENEGFSMVASAESEEFSMEDPTESEVSPMEISTEQVSAMEVSAESDLSKMEIPAVKDASENENTVLLTITEDNNPEPWIVVPKTQEDSDAN